MKIQVYLFTGAQTIVMRVNVHSLHRNRQMAQLRAQRHLFCVTISTAFCSQRPINYTEILLTADISLCSSRWHTFKQQSWNLLCSQFEGIKRWENQGECLLLLLHQFNVRQREWKGFLRKRSLVSSTDELCNDVLLVSDMTWKRITCQLFSFTFSVSVVGSTLQDQKSKPPAYTESYSQAVLTYWTQTELFRNQTQAQIVNLYSSHWGNV